VPGHGRALELPASQDGSSDLQTFLPDPHRKFASRTVGWWALVPSIAKGLANNIERGEHRREEEK
jgi:hypothetical protein